MNFKTDCPAMSRLAWPLGGLVFLEKDLGTTIVLCAIFSAVYFAAGARLVHIGTGRGGRWLIGGAAAIVLCSVAGARLMAFLDPYQIRGRRGYQVVQSLYAIGSGGVLGEGFAKASRSFFICRIRIRILFFRSSAKSLGWSEPWRLWSLSGCCFGVEPGGVMAPDRFGMLLGIGIITGIIVQALFNISVVISILPAKGIPLPFISYGGSSVVVTLFGVGILLNISTNYAESA